MIDFDATEVRTWYRARVSGLRLIQGKLRAPCPIHHGKDPNFAIEQDTGRWFCHSQCARGGDMIGLEMELSGSDFIRAKLEVFRIVGRPVPSSQERDIEATYDYTDTAGKLLYQVVRRVGKRFSQRRPAPDGRLIWGLGNMRPVPFHLPKLIQSQDNELVAVVEGEKDVLNLERAGWTATCNNGGAGNFKADLAPWFARKRVAIVPDNDVPGRRHAEAVARLLAPVAASVRIVEIPDLALKGDVSDFLAAGGTGEDLCALYEQMPDWSEEWKFESPVPHENDKYLRTFGQFVAECGGYDGFWASLDVDGLSTPFEKLTGELGGMRAGEVYVLGANQGAGKTSLVHQFAIKALEERAGVLIFSMEMGFRDVFQRIAAIDGCIDLRQYRRLKRIRPDGEEFLELDRRLKESTRKFARAALAVSTRSAVTPEFLVEESQRVKERSKVDLVIVDHMQLMGAEGKPRPDYEKFTAISRATKGIATELGVPLLLVSQTSRLNSKERRSDLEVSDLRGSGAIEEDAAAVMLLYYDAEDFKDAKKDPKGDRMRYGPLKAWLKLAKNRYGVSGTREALNHRKALTRFDPVAAA